MHQPHLVCFLCAAVPALSVLLPLPLVLWNAPLALSTLQNVLPRTPHADRPHLPRFSDAVRKATPCEPVVVRKERLLQDIVNEALAWDAPAAWSGARRDVPEHPPRRHGGAITQDVAHEIVMIGSTPSQTPDSRFWHLSTYPKTSGITVKNYFYL